MHLAKIRQNSHEKPKIRILVERRQAENATNQQKPHFRYVGTRFSRKYFVQEKTAKKNSSPPKRPLFIRKKGAFDEIYPFKLLHF